MTLNFPILYIKINLLLSVGILYWLGFQALYLRRPRLSQIGLLVKIGHFLLITGLAIPLIVIWIPNIPLKSPSLQIWAAPTFHSSGNVHFRSSDVISFSSRDREYRKNTSLALVDKITLLFFLTGIAWAGLRFSMGIRRVLFIINSGHPIRKIGRLRLLLSDVASVPFSFWTPWGAFVVIPFELVSRRVDFQLAILHEIQHHRQGDTRWTYFSQGLKICFFWNPLIHIWERTSLKLQELACDEILVRTKDISPHEYACCLLSAADIAIQSQPAFTAVARMAVSESGQTLKRRIEMIFEHSLSGRKITHPIVFRTAGIVTALAILAAVAFASEGAVQDRRVTLAEAQKMAQSASRPGNFPIVVNNSVVTQLNRYLGTPDGRTFIRNSLQRLETYRPMIEKKIKTYSLPMELLAVPIVESGYQNQKRSPGAGLWMFISSTARNYNLMVDHQTDERLQEDLETDAAMRFLGANYLRFQDWQLAILAYNAGETQVQKGINSIHTRDAWKLIQAGYEGDKDYLPMVMAAILIIKNPSVLAKSD